MTIVGIRKYWYIKMSPLELYRENPRASSPSTPVRIPTLPRITMKEKARLIPPEFASTVARTVVTEFTRSEASVTTAWAISAPSTVPITAAVRLTCRLFRIDSPCAPETLSAKLATPQLVSPGCPGIGTWKAEKTRPSRGTSRKRHANPRNGMSPVRARGGLTAAPAIAPRLMRW